MLCIPDHGVALSSTTGPHFQLHGKSFGTLLVCFPKIEHRHKQNAKKNLTKNIQLHAETNMKINGLFIAVFCPIMVLASPL